MYTYWAEELGKVLDKHEERLPVLHVMIIEVYAASLNTKS